MAKARDISKANQSKFLEGIRKYIESIPGVEMIGDQAEYDGRKSPPEWRIPTRYGPLRLHPSELSFRLYTLFTRFEQPHGKLGSNPYSGKWNFHASGGHEVADVIDDIGRQIDAIL